MSCSITQLETVKLPLSLQIAIVDEAIRKIENVIGPIGILINLKMIDIIRKISIFEILKSFSNIKIFLNYKFLLDLIDIFKVMFNSFIIN